VDSKLDLSFENVLPIKNQCPVLLQLLIFHNLRLLSISRSLHLLFNQLHNQLHMFSQHLNLLLTYSLHLLQLFIRPQKYQSINLNLQSQPLNQHPLLIKTTIIFPSLLPNHNLIQLKDGDGHQHLHSHLSQLLLISSHNTQGREDMTNLNLQATNTATLLNQAATSNNGNIPPLKDTPNIKHILTLFHLRTQI